MDGTHDRDLYDIDWDNPDVANLFKQARKTSFKKGDILLRPYDETEYVHTLLSGLVKVYTIDAQGNENMGIIYGRGDVFPIGWIIQERHQHAYFQAMTDCEIALLPKGIFLEQLKVNPMLAFAVIQKLLEQIYVYAARANNLGLRYARERLAYRLLVLCARFGTRQPDGSITIPHITQQDLASTINVSRENVNREIIRLEKMGIVSYTRSAITIYQPNALRKELGKGVQVMFFDDSILPESGEPNVRPIVSDRD